MYLPHRETLYGGTRGELAPHFQAVDLEPAGLFSNMSTYVSPYLLCDFCASFSVFSLPPLPLSPLLPSRLSAVGAFEHPLPHHRCVVWESLW